ncbi:RsmB/NOP family class I SAM-dependent RNA methyltransferase [Candidatus Clavichlamydia salmonicola]|uniref:RsmB/NOP family class I SAM-dependent RNA methyltransferase n=1 Tax=Candidatus Clavichlamydia salmonicola TaxID=469812 RepID=UPI0018918309|nr:RsmB/NOP family class I SAM-dependent RNA methyltransferase [Candidatus Clavichlamydia salmonicola]
MNAFRQNHAEAILKAIEDSDSSPDGIIQAYFRSHKALGSKDRAFISDILFTYIRYKNLVEALVGENQATLENKIKFLAEGFDYKKYEDDESLPLYIRVGFPEELFRRLSEAYGDGQAFDLCQISNQQAPTTLRINPLKFSREAFMETFGQDFEMTESSRVPYAISMLKRFPFKSFPEFNEGCFEFQDEGAQIVCEAITVRPGDHILDYCAGAGGKSLALAPRVGEEGYLVLHDLRAALLQEATKRMKRAGIFNCQMVKAGALKADKCAPFDQVLVDVPCSGTGTLRRNPHHKWRFFAKDQRRTIRIQRQLVTEAAQFLAPNGRLTYITCSILPEENEEQTEFFIEHLSLERDRPDLFILPEAGGADGFYASFLRKKKA